VDLQDSTLEMALQNPGYLIRGVFHKSHCPTLQNEEKWLLLQAPAVGDAVEMAGELAVAGEAVAEMTMLPFQGRHQRLGSARS
jgi:hypothetical protein